MIFIISNRQVDGKINQYFIAYIGLVCLLLIFDTWEHYLSSLSRLNEWRYFTSAMCYTLRVVTITVLNILLHYKSKGRVLLWIPPIVLALFAFTSKYTHWMFYFNDLNYWQAGPLRFLPHITSGLCMLILIVKTIANQKRYKSEVNTLFAFIIIINILATIVETKTPVRFLLTGTMMVSCVLYYSVINKDNEMLRTKKYEQELADSKISIMLSQIQPHFLYNALNSIRQLCKSDPLAAQTAIEDFATYLRGNLDSIKRKTPIPFTKELEHIRIYLALEKMRFEDELQIVWNVKADSFMLPALTVQPLVENAVKYGVGKKPGGGTVTIATTEMPDAYVITVSDDGIGYDPTVTQDDGRTHIGIDNVRSRLASMCGGALSIETTMGVRYPQRKKNLSQKATEYAKCGSLSNVGVSVQKGIFRGGCG